MMHGVKLSADTIRKIGLALGRDILQTEEGSVGSLEEFSERDLNDFRLLESRSGVMAVSYIRYKLERKENLDIIVSFFAAVVQQGIPVQEWVRPCKPE